MDIVEIATKIEFLCELIGKKSAELAKFAASEKLATALANYDKSMELAIAQLQSKGIPTTVIKDRAKGMCRDQLFEVKSLEIKWKAMLSILRSTEARLNGYQSANKYLSNL